jgi:hypothetical protein
LKKPTANPGTQIVASVIHNSFKSLAVGNHHESLSLSTLDTLYKLNIDESYTDEPVEVYLNYLFRHNTRSDTPTRRIAAGIFFLRRTAFRSDRLVRFINSFS